MNILFDTNVLISAFLFSGLSADVYDYCYIYHKIFSSSWIMNELKEKLEQKFKIPKKEIDNIFIQINQGCKLVIPDGNVPDVCRDKDDNNILHICNSISIDYLITGDSDLLNLKKYNKTKIVNPREFWTIIKDI